jgi:hypothetical protein
MIVSLCSLRAPLARALPAVSLAFALAIAPDCAGAPSPPVASSTYALTIPGLFSTGVDGTGAPLTGGSVDPHYRLTSTDAFFPGPNPSVVAPSPGFAADTSTSAWISVQPNGTGDAGNTYTYTLTFSLSGDPATASLSGQWACAPGCSLLLNGTMVAVKAAPGSGTLDPFSIPTGSPFVMGSNTLAFAVTTTSGGPTGLQVNALSGAVEQCTMDSQCSAGEFCDTVTNACTAKLINATPIPNLPGHTPVVSFTCTAAAGMSVCASGVCASDNQCGYPPGGPCTASTGASVCRTGACAGATCAAPRFCTIDSDCPPGNWCNASASMCASLNPNGVPIPIDPGHGGVLNGTCTSAAAALVCLSGVCDVHDNGCGYALGDGACTPSIAITVCRSGDCSVAGTCMRVGGCNVDGDCGAASRCNLTTGLCQPVDAGLPDAASPDAGIPDAQTPDAVTPDTATGAVDARPADQSAPRSDTLIPNPDLVAVGVDAAIPAGPASGCSCDLGQNPPNNNRAIFLLLALALPIGLGRRRSRGR